MQNLQCNIQDSQGRLLIIVRTRKKPNMRERRDNPQIQDLGDIDTSVRNTCTIEINEKKRKSSK